MPLSLKSPFADPGQRMEAGRMGMWLFLGSLAMLFAASIVGFAVIRVQLADEWPDDLPALPAVVWLGTGVLLFSGVTVQRAVVTTRRGDDAAGAVTLTALLGCVFLALQVVACLSWLARLDTRWETTVGHRLALAGFLVLSSLHGLHVVGGLVPMFTLAVRGWRRPAPLPIMSVRFCAMYWHFLGGVWIALLAALLVGR